LIPNDSVFQYRSIPSSWCSFKDHLDVIPKHSFDSHGIIIETPYQLFLSPSLIEMSWVEVEYNSFLECNFRANVSFDSQRISIFNLKNYVIIPSSESVFEFNWCQCIVWFTTEIWNILNKNSLYFKPINCIPYKDIVLYQIIVSLKFRKSINRILVHFIDAIGFFDSWLNWKEYNAI